MNEKLTKLCEEVIEVEDPLHHRTRVESFASAYKSIKAAPILAKALKLYMERKPCAWIVVRDSESDPAELFLTEEAASNNASLGLSNAHVFALVIIPSGELAAIEKELP